MSDDEAFIRGIVANPGDEAPRLIYADWLEEREDSRGAYLRAEVDFARTTTPPFKKAIIASFKTAWKRTDQVWAARVSRPPLGICCEHLHFSRSGNEISRLDIGQLETSLQVKVPPAYQAFLLNHNGGIPEPRWYLRKGDPVPELAVRFYPATLAPTTQETGQRYYGDLIQATEALYAGNHPPTGPRRLIAMMAASYPISILIGVLGVRNGCIYRIHESHFEGEDLNGAEKIADSLPDFLSTFGPRS